LRSLQQMVASGALAVRLLRSFTAQDEALGSVPGAPSARSLQNRAIGR
jgi:hypothetical protein